MARVIRRRYRFIGRDIYGRYVWQSTDGWSVITADPVWFWSGFRDGRDG